MRPLRRSRSAWWIASLAVVAAACAQLSDLSEPKPIATPVASVQLSAPRPTIVEGNTLALEVVVLDATGQPISGRPVTWSSSDTLTATVSSAGVVRGRRPGRVQIAASADGKSAVVPITVAPRLVASVSITPTTPSMLVGGAVQLRARTVDEEGLVLTDRPVFWSTSDATIAAVDNTGFVTGVSAGLATITATSETRSATVGVTVAPVPVATVQLTPALDTVFVGQSTQLRVITRDSTGALLDGRAVTWSSSAPAAATVSATGLVVGIAPGAVIITAQSEGRSGTARVVVRPQPVGAVLVSPSQATVAIGQALRLTVQVIDDDGTLLQGRPVQYRSSNATIATVGADGTVTGIAPGSVTITATSEGRSGTATIAVTPSAVRAVRVDPLQAAIRVGGTTRLTAVALGDNDAVLPQRTITWLSGAPGIVTVGNDGTVTGVAPGTALVFASAEGRVASATITVTSIAIGSVVVTPPTSSPVQGTALSLAAEVRDGAGAVLTGRTINWSSSAPAIAVVSNSGRVLAVSPGTARIDATVEGVTGSATITVLPVPVASVSITLNVPSVIIGQTGQATAVPRDANGNVLTGRTATWTSSAPTIATVSSTGVITGVALGSATITGTVEGRSGTVQVTVIPVPVSSVSVTLTDSSLNIGQSAQGTAVPRDANGQPLARPVTWGSATPAIANVSATGLVTGIAEGTTAITATSEGRTGAVQLVVIGRPVATVTVTVPRSGIRISEVLQATAVLRDSVGVQVNRPITWTSSAPTIATVSTTGAITALAVGSATITATSEGRSGTVSVSITPIPVGTVTPSLPRPIIRIGETLQAAVVVRDSANNIVTRPVTWTSGTPATATISATGLITAVAPGTTTLTATSEGRSGTVQLTVTPIPVTSVTVNVPRTTIRQGETLQATTTLRDSLGATVTRPVTWSAAPTAIGTVSATGLLTAVAPGTVTVTATSEGVNGTAEITVTAAPVATVTVTVPRTGIRIGESIQATAVLRDSLGNVLTNRPITWASTNTTAATVSATGLVTAIAAGTSNITATSEGRTGSVTLTITPPPVATVTVTLPRSPIRIGETLQASVVLRDSLGNTLTGRTLTWTSTATNVASVSSTGLITAVAAGSATITATSEGRNGSQTLLVTVRPVASMTISLTVPADSILTRGRSANATVVQRDSTNAILTGRQVTWGAAPASVGSISVSGQISTATNAGPLTISVRSDSVPGTPRATNTFGMRVTNINTVGVTPALASVRVGQTVSLTATARDLGGSVVPGTTFTWSTAAATLATVSPAGVVTGVAPGIVTIAASADGRSGGAVITVLP
ncbi:MAG: Ig-like domain-containing protein [Gemmatimonadaceae bacterium]|nr:Ig-like domain-containing protein [Gemmatimonadaceae bacterium]